LIVLDTHALLWWVNGDDRLLSPAAAAAINKEAAGGAIAVSSITAWEIAMLVERGRVSLSLDVTAWLALVEAIETLRFVPVDNEIGVAAVRLPGDFHKDPADRLIVATARKYGAPVVTADEKIQNYPHVQTIW
jgi:PIN domain nuclease of toxin-antitoxin system